MSGAVVLLYFGLLARPVDHLAVWQISLANNPGLLIVFVLLVAIVFDVVRQRLNRLVDPDFLP